jgi:haloalkane dehalogenase
MKVKRTPDERFEDLPDYGFQPNYAELQNLRVHYLDEGDAGADPVVMIHGEPTWSYLYRKMIPIVVAAGHRVIAPDLVGFGRSDKPEDPSDYSYERHVEWMRTLLFDRLDLSRITLVGQDWGGLIGLRLVAEHPDRFSRVVAANTLLPTGDHSPGPDFEAWRKYSQEVPDFSPGEIVSHVSKIDLTPEIRAAYDAPFPDDSYKAGARVFPMLVPTTPDDPAAPANRAAWEGLRRFDKPFLKAFSDGDPITAPHQDTFDVVPGARDQPHTTIVGAGHFLQEDRGEDLARVINKFIESTPS